MRLGVMALCLAAPPPPTPQFKLNHGRDVVDAQHAKKAAGESIKRLDVLEQALKQCDSNCDSPDKVQQMTDAVRNF